MIQRFFLRYKIYVFIAIGIGLISLGAWKFYTYTQEKIETYRINAALAEQALANAETTLQVIERDLQKLHDEFKIVEKQFKEANDRVYILEEKLSKHDLGFLAQSKPKLVENIIDNATTDVLRCFEIESGSPLTKDEINATKKSEINTSCPDIANPSYSD